MTDASARGRSNRRKGATFERQIAKWVLDELGVKVERQLKQYQQAQHGDLDPIGLFLPECKAHQRLAVKSWWVQTVQAAKARDCIPLLIYRIPRQGWRAVLPDELAWSTLAPWRYDFEFTKDISPACLALNLREHLATLDRIARD
jgi:hypothetical protein